MKFVELCAEIGVKKSWDEKKIKEENDGSHFSSMYTAGTQGTFVVRKGEHPTCTGGAHSTGTVAPAKMAPVACNGTQEQVSKFTNGTMLGSYSSTRQVGARAAHMTQFWGGLACTCTQISVVTVASSEMSATCAPCAHSLPKYTRQDAYSAGCGHTNFHVTIFQVFS